LPAGLGLTSTRNVGFMRPAWGNGVDPWRVVGCMIRMIRMVRHGGGLWRCHVMAVV